MKILHALFHNLSIALAASEILWYNYFFLLLYEFLFLWHTSNSITITTLATLRYQTETSYMAIVLTMQDVRFFHIDGSYITYQSTTSTSIRKKKYSFGVQRYSKGHRFAHCCKWLL